MSLRAMAQRQRRKSLTMTAADLEIMNARRCSLGVVPERRRPSLISRWFKHFSDVTDAHNKKEGKTRRPEPTPDNDDEEIVQDFPQPQDVSERAEEVNHVENEDNFGASASNGNSGAETDSERIETDKEDHDGGTPAEGGGCVGVQNRVTAEDWPLIQPSQVHVAVPPVHTAESRLTPIEQIRRKDEEVRRALADKENLIADLLSIPQQDFHTIADMVGEEEAVADPVNLIMASIYQTNRLHKIINDSLNVSSEAEPVLATGGRNASCVSQTTPRCDHPPSVAVSQVQDIANRLSKHLTELLEKQKQLEDEKTLLRNELHKVRERLHEQLSLHDSSASTTAVTDSNALENDEEVEMDSGTTAGS
ncbi:hypothetical protein HHI36_019025 [Cryptolaemus montrouzieri]|uniref:Uncharacterized protein n=1 Tax=Cryptolaemus montrouzieri TaxID=559131 RepID=A0ABD2P2F3_9CUCU